MVEGYPLQYSNLFFDVPPSPTHPFYHHYNYYNMAENSDDLLVPHSPNSIQSDSDNSISSTDIVPKTIISKIKPPLATKNSEIKCGWYQCGLWFESLDLLANHVSKAHASSGPSGLFYCGWEGCSRNNKGFNARYKMLVHVRTHTNEKPHQCCLCDKSFSRAENLKIHSRSHSGEKPYLCPVPGCKKAYSNSSDRFKHTRTHQVEKPYLCKVPGCPKRYTDPSSLRKHVKTYKHFVTDQNIKTELKQENRINEQITTNKLKQIDNNTLNLNSDIFKNSAISSCSCRHNCCLKTCLNKAAELLKFSSLINYNKTDMNCVSWNRLLDPIVQSRNMCVNYKEEQMDIDAPLDLTVHRKISH